MRISKNTLNNMMMDNQRRTPLYQTIITDLAITGNIDREDAEMLLGYEIPDFLHTPDGTTLKAESTTVSTAITTKTTATAKTTPKE